jgi:hypothetical protein
MVQFPERASQNLRFILRFEFRGTGDEMITGSPWGLNDGDKLMLSVLRALESSKPFE